MCRSMSQKYNKNWEEITMHKLFSVQISLLIIFAGAFSGMLIFTDVYDDIKSTIVEKTCYSCIKMDPISRIDFTFDTVDNSPHPSFVLDNLTKGPVFLAFRQDVCTSCDKMEPILKDIFRVEFGKKELFYQTLNYSGTNIIFFHINIDNPYEKETEAFFVYDKDRRSGVPMFVMITLGKNDGTVQPYYMTAYGTLGTENNKERKDYFIEMISKGIELYNYNSEDYK